MKKINSTSKLYKDQADYIIKNPNSYKTEDIDKVIKALGIHLAKYRKDSLSSDNSVVITKSIKDSTQSDLISKKLKQLNGILLDRKKTIKNDIKSLEDQVHLFKLEVNHQKSEMSKKGAKAITDEDLEILENDKRTLEHRQDRLRAKRQELHDFPSTQE